MEKYILVTQDEYNKLQHSPSKQNLPIRSSPSSSFKIPPPGLPASDSFSQAGIQLTKSEAEQIEKKINQTTKQALSAERDYEEGGFESDTSDSHPEVDWRSWLDRWETVSTK